MNFDPKKIEENVHEFWNKEKIPEKIVEFNEDREKFYLLDGPPYVNDNPHVGHVKTTTFKDIWGKFKFMQGFSVWFQPGFDCGGLPIENAVEKKLGIKTKSDIKKLGIDKFIEECKNLATLNKSVWLNIYKKLGAWRGWLEPYMTSDDSYRESGWWTVKKLFEKGLLVEGLRPGFWCPRCETVLAGYEVTDSYKDLEDISIFIKFKLKSQKNTYLLVWTTTPWTLPANVAICIHPDEQYVKVKIGAEYLILAEARLEILDKLEKQYEIVEKFKGSELEGEKYEPLLDIPLQKELEKNENAHQVVVSIPIMKKRVASKVKLKKDVDEEEFGHLVTMDMGSGLVHIAPGHGDVDNRLGKHYNLPEPSPVDEKGCLTDETGKFSGLYVKDANPIIIKELGSKLFYEEKIVHSYPLCWRCKTPLIYRMSRQWFLKIDTLKDKLLSENKKITWLPNFAAERMENLLAESPDWAITRQRYWGIPLPIWKCKKCGAKKVIGSVEELKKEAIKLPKKLELTVNVIDKIKIKCDCGAEAIREPDIMDVWFDSSISPWASLGYPFKNKELFENLFPVDLIDESQDQVRGWFYYLLFSSTAVFGKSSYKKVCLNGWVLDEKGEKMSKSVGNVIFADAAIKELGSDLLRLYYCYDVSPWDMQKFSMQNAKELGRSLNILFNLYNYFNTYLRLETNRYNLTGEDKWIVSRLNSLIKKCTDDLENFRFHEVGRSIVNFIIEDFSRTYVKIIRGRKDKALDYVFTHVFEKLLRLMAPITPFISEYLYNNIFNESVHLQQWPTAEEKLIDAELEEKMEIARKIIEASNVIRKEHSLKLKWPLQALYVKGVDLTAVDEIIKKLSNVKQVIITDEAHTFPSKEIKINNNVINVYLDTEITDELKLECLLRELIREVQAKRKENKLVVDQKIKLTIDNQELKKFEDIIAESVGASEIVFSDVTKPMAKVCFENLEAGFTFEKCD